MSCRLYIAVVHESTIARRADVKRGMDDIFQHHMFFASLQAFHKARFSTNVKIETARK